jgi:hypothetical protein
MVDSCPLGARDDLQTLKMAYTYLRRSRLVDHHKSWTACGTLVQHLGSQEENPNESLEPSS